MTMSVAAQERLDGKAPKELTKEERLAKRKESLTAADTPEDRRGTKEKPEKQTFRENLAAGLSSRRQAEGGAGKGKAKVEVVEEEEEEWEDEGEEDEEPPPPPPSSLVRRVSQRV